MNCKVKKAENESERKIDLRHIDPAYFHPFKNYSMKESELFKEATKFEHFKKRVDILLERRKKGTLVFLPKGEGIFLLTLKHYVLNEVPTRDKDLRGDIYLYLGKKLTEREKDEINENYADYLKKFRTNLKSEGRINNEE